MVYSVYTAVIDFTPFKKKTHMRFTYVCFCEVLLDLLSQRNVNVTKYADVLF